MFGRIIARRMSSLAQPLSKRAKGQYAVPNTPSYKKLMDRQSYYCADDGLYVWQKSSTDMLLYRGVCVVIAVGFLMTVESIRRLATPPKNE